VDFWWISIRLVSLSLVVVGSLSIDMDIQDAPELAFFSMKLPETRNDFQG
jgi:hypothetical protein